MEGVSGNEHVVFGAVARWIGRVIEATNIRKKYTRCQVKLINRYKIVNHSCLKV